MITRPRQAPAGRLPNPAGRPARSRQTSHRWGGGWSPVDMAGAAAEANRRRRRRPAGSAAHFGVVQLARQASDVPYFPFLQRALSQFRRNFKIWVAIREAFRI